MSARSSSRVVLALLAAFGLAVLLFAGALDRELQGPGARSSGDEGRMGLRLLLEGLGFDARAWAQAPGELPRAGAVLWVPAAPPRPIGPPAGAANDNPLPPGPSAEVRRALCDPIQYRRFVGEGGTLVCAVDSGVLAALSDALASELLARLKAGGPGRGAEDSEAPAELWIGEGPSLRVRGLENSFVSVARSAPEVDPSAAGTSGAAGGNVDDRGRADASVADDDDWSATWPRELEVLATDGAGRPFAARLELGRGAVVVLADAGFTRNDRIFAADNGLAALRLLEAAGARPDRPVLFDEYAAGGARAESLTQLLSSPRAAIGSLHAAALLAVLAWLASTRRGFGRDDSKGPRGPTGSTEPAPSGRSGLARALGLAGLYARSNQRAVLARELVGAARRSAGARLLGRRLDVRECLALRPAAASTATGAASWLDELLARVEAGAPTPEIGRRRAAALAGVPDRLRDLDAAELELYGEALAPWLGGRDDGRAQTAAGRMGSTGGRATTAGPRSQS